MIAVLALEDGTWYRGVSAGAPGETTGEVVFNTSMTGYQEVLTDPSYAGQIVTMTAPQIGNYGVAHADQESRAAAGGRLHHARPVADFQQLALAGDAARLPHASRHRRHRRHRHPRPHPQAAVGRRHARRDRHGFARSAGAGRAGARDAADGRRRPGEDGHLRRALRLHDDARRCRGRGGVRCAAAASAPRDRCGSRPTTTASSSTSCAGWRRTAARSACSRRTRRPPRCWRGSRTACS